MLGQGHSANRAKLRTQATAPYWLVGSRLYLTLLYLMLISSNLIGKMAGWQFWMSHDMYQWSYNIENCCRNWTFSILDIHRFPHFSPTCFDISGWNFVNDFIFVSPAKHSGTSLCQASVCQSVCLSGSHNFVVVAYSYVSQATHAFLGLLPLCCELQIKWLS